MELPLKARRTSGALTAQGERTSRRMYGDFHAHGHGGHSEPISEFSRHREVVLLRGWTWSRDALSGPISGTAADSRRRATIRITPITRKIDFLRFDVAVL